MVTDKMQLLRDPDIGPTADAVKRALEGAYEAYEAFLEELCSRDIRLIWRYYRDGRAWLAKGVHARTGARGGRSEKTVFWLSVWEGFFRMTVYVPEKYRAQVCAQHTDERVAAMAAESEVAGKTKAFPLVFDISSTELLGPVLAAVELRKNLK